MDDFKELTSELLQQLERWTGREIAKDLKERAHRTLERSKADKLVNALEWISKVSATEYEYKQTARNALQEWYKNG